MMKCCGFNPNQILGDSEFSSNLLKKKNTDLVYFCSTNCLYKSRNNVLGHWFQQLLQWVMEASSNCRGARFHCHKPSIGFIDCLCCLMTGSNTLEHLTHHLEHETTLLCKHERADNLPNSFLCNTRLILLVCEALHPEICM